MGAMGKGEALMRTVFVIKLLIVVMVAFLLFGPLVMRDCVGTRPNPPTDVRVK